MIECLVIQMSFQEDLIPKYKTMTMNVFTQHISANNAVSQRDEGFLFILSGNVLKVIKNYCPQLKRTDLPILGPASHLGTAQSSQRFLESVVQHHGPGSLSGLRQWLLFSRPLTKICSQIWQVGSRKTNSKPDRQLDSCLDTVDRQMLCRQRDVWQWCKKYLHLLLK